MRLYSEHLLLSRVVQWLAEQKVLGSILGQHPPTVQRNGVWITGHVRVCDGLSLNVRPVMDVRGE